MPSRRTITALLLTGLSISGCGGPDVDVEPAERGVARTCIEAWNDLSNGPLDPHETEALPVVVAKDGDDCRIVVMHEVDDGHSLMELRKQDGNFKLWANGRVAEDDLAAFRANAVLDPDGELRPEPDRATDGSTLTGPLGGSLETCLADVGAPADPHNFEDNAAAALADGGAKLSDAVAPPNDDYWLAIDMPDEKHATLVARSLALAAANGMFGPLEVRRAGVSVAMLPPPDGPLEDGYRDLPDIKKLRRCTKHFKVVSVGYARPRSTNAHNPFPPTSG